MNMKHKRINWRHVYLSTINWGILKEIGVYLTKRKKKQKDTRSAYCYLRCSLWLMFWNWSSTNTWLNNISLIILYQVNNMFHDESVGVKKLNVFVVKLVIKKDGVSETSTVDWLTFWRVDEQSSGKAVGGRTTWQVAGLIQFFHFSSVMTLRRKIEIDLASSQTGRHRGTQTAHLCLTKIQHFPTLPFF